jgi:hypothetical protein
MGVEIYSHVFNKINKKKTKNMSEKIRTRIRANESTPIIPEYGNTFDMLSRDLNFMDDVRFEPSPILLENYGTLINGYTPSDWDTVYRANRDSYLKLENEFLICNMMRISPQYSYPTNYHIQVNPVYDYYTLLTKLPDYPVGVTAWYGGSPLIVEKVKTRLQITETSVTMFPHNYLEQTYLPILNEETGEYEQNPILTQFYSEVNLRMDYYKYQFKSLIQDLTEEEQSILDSGYGNCISFYTNPDYYKSLWSSRETAGYWEVFDENDNPIIPSDIFGDITDIHQLSYINRMRDLPSIGNVGDVIIYIGSKDEYGNQNYEKYAWDGRTNEWSTELYDTFIEPIDVRRRANRDGKLKSKNEVLLGLRPFLMAANYLPSFKLNRVPTTTTTTEAPTTTTTTTTEAPTTTTTTTTLVNTGTLILPFTANNSDTINGEFGSSTGYFKVTYWDGTSEVKGDGSIYQLNSKNGTSYFEKQFNSSDSNNGQIVITSCTSDGTLSGVITFVRIDNLHYGVFEVNGLTDLIYLSVNNTSLTSLDVTGLINLQYLLLGANQSLISLDVTGLNNLQILLVSSNQSLISLDMAGLSNLTELVVYNMSSLTSLDVAGLNNLQNLQVRYNPLLTSLDVTGSSNLTYLSLENNSFDSSDIDNMLIELDTNGGSNGNFRDVNIPRTSVSDSSYTNLINKGWTIQLG